MEDKIDDSVTLILFLRRNLGGLGSLLLGLILLSFLLVNLLEERERGSLGLVNLLLDLLGSDALVASLTLDSNLAEVLNESLKVLALSGVDLVLELADGCQNKRLALPRTKEGKHTLLGLSANRISTVGLLDDSPTGLISLSVLLSIGDHIFNVVLVQTGRRGDGHGLVLAGGLVLGGDVNDAIC
jgi:hypothetical protein